MLYYYTGIIRKLTLLKLFNFLKLALGYYISRVSGKPYQLGMPIFVSVEPTTSCNLRCPQCPSGLRAFTRSTGILQEPLFKSTIMQLKDRLHSLTFYFQGEPYLHPGFLDMVAFANQHRIYTITSTNAHYLNPEKARATVESGLDKLIISIDGTTQEAYAQYRTGGDLEKVIKGTEEIIRQKKLVGSKKPFVVWQFVVFKSNEHQVEEIRKMGKEMGVDKVQIKTAQIYDFENGNTLIPDNPALSRYRLNSEGRYEIRNKLRNQCWRMWQGCVITWDGKVVPCCFDKDARYRLGDLQSESFRKVWFSDAYNKFRAAVLRSRKEIDICKNCSEGTKVWS